MKTLNFVDIFCGAGGTSTGAVEAMELLGYRSELTAINHWPVAIATHKENHPGARHLCTSVDDVNPRTLFAPGALDLFWASPECTHHSNARGGKPSNEQSRATAWCVPRWMEASRPGIVQVENVPEFLQWGPKKNGAVFKAWFAACCSMGYRGDWRVLCSADYGDPTTRRRLFVQFVRGKRKIVWPDPTHTALEGAKLPQWIPARDIIDWSLTGESIYDRKRPLKPNTMRRIMVGLEKFGLGPFIVPGMGDRKGQKPRTHDVRSPLPTVAASGHLHLAEPFVISAGGPKCGARGVSKPLGTVLTRDHRALVEPFLVCMEHGGRVREIKRPVPTVTTAKGGAIGLAEPFLVHVAHGNGSDENGDARRTRSLTRPMPTVCGERGEWALIESGLLPQHSGGMLRRVSEPAPTVATDGAIGLVEPFLVEYYGTGGAQSVKKPMPTVPTKDRFGLVRPVVIVKGKRYLLDIRFRMLQPSELAAAQGFRGDYKFTGNKTETVKQIGNAVTRNLARALVLAALSQQSDIRPFLKRKVAA